LEELELCLDGGEGAVDLCDVWHLESVSIDFAKEGGNGIEIGIGIG
jgi:hypothetical protein